MKPSGQTRFLRLSRSLVLAAALAVPACGQPSSGSGSGAASGAAEAPKPPPPEVTMFAPTPSILADLPVMKLIPKKVTAVLAARDPATVLAKVSALAGFADAKEPLAKELDAAAKDLSKDLPELAALAQSGVDLSKPVGVVLFDPDFETLAIFASVSDEAAMKQWFADRAKQSNGKRELTTAGDATVLRARKWVTRALVLRKGHVFWVRSRDRRLDDEDTTAAAAAEALTATTEADSLGADPAFSKAIGALAYGGQASLYMNSGWFAESVVTQRKAAVSAAEKALTEAQAALAKAETKKRKRAIDEAKVDVDGAERAKKLAEESARQVDVLALAKDALPGIAVGLELGDREIKLKAFVATSSAAAVKVLAPLQRPVALFEPSLGARKAVHLAVDPKLLDFAMKHFAPRGSYTAALPLADARSSLVAFGVPADKLDPLLDGEVSAATHVQKVSLPPPAEDAGAPDAGAAPAPTEGERTGFSVMWGVSDPGAMKGLLDDAWKAQETTERATKGLVKKLGEGSFELGSAYPGDLAKRIRLAGNMLLVTTHGATADAAGDGKPRTTWMAASDHPALKQLAGIEGASAIVALDRVEWRTRSLWGKQAGLLDSMSFGMLGLFGGSSAKTKKLREQRDKLVTKRNELESALDAHKDATWAKLEERVGKVVLFAKPAGEGVAVYGGVFTPEPSVTALAEAGLAAWLSVGPRWERWGELTDVRKKIRDIDDKIEAESQKAMDDMVGDVLRGLGASDPLSGGVPGGVLGGPGGLGSRGWDDDLGGGIGGLTGAGAGTIGSGAVKQGGGGSGKGYGGVGPDKKK